VSFARFLGRAPIAALAILALGVSASSATIPNGTTIRTVLHKGINSATLTPGTDFELHVDDPSQPLLDGAIVFGHVTDVTGPAGLTRASISFLFDYIRFRNGQKEAFHGSVVSRNVTPTNTAVLRQEQAKFNLPPMPVGTVTPGPIAFQINFRSGSKPSVSPPPGGNSGGVAYAQQNGEQIVVPPGTPILLRLTAELTIK
jgi:hypothetical protein